jgi:magnesium-transporting ATPase (P-type)
MRSWYDLTKEEKQNLKNEYSTKNNDNGKIIVLNILKVIFYLISFVMFFIVIILIISKINEHCYEHYCDNNLMLFGSLFVMSLSIAIIFSVIVSKIKKHFDLWLKSKNIEK